MPDLSYQVRARGGRRWATAASVAIIVLANAGCAPRATFVSFEPLASFPDKVSRPGVVVLGRFDTCLPGADPTPALSRFLYGPADSGDTPLRNPQGMALLGDQLLVCDQGRGEVIAMSFSSGRSLGWGDDRQKPRCPVDVAVAADGRVYIADTTLRAVLVHEPTGAFVETLSPPGDPEGDFRPAGVLVMDGVLYVADVGRRCVARWSVGERCWLKPLVPHKGHPGFAAPVAVARGPRRDLLIVDAVRRLVYRVVPGDDRWLEPIGRPGRLAGEFVRPKKAGCACGLILVSDAGRQSVLVFDSEGRYVTEVHEQSEAWTGWTLPTGIVSLRVEDLNPLVNQGKASLPAGLDGYVIVSDTLGGDSLTLLGIKGGGNGEAGDAR